MASFVNLDTLGLRRTKRDTKPTVKLKESRITDPRNKSLAFHNPMVMLIMALTAFTTATTDMAMTSCAYATNQERLSIMTSLKLTSMVVLISSIYLLKYT